MTPTLTAPGGSRRRPLWALVALIAVLALLAAFLLTRALTVTTTPATPSGLTIESAPGAVSASWDTVEGSTYELLRDDGVVVYSGSETSAVDRTVSAGEYTYRVRAVVNGAASEPSAGESARVSDGWGRYGPLVAQFPELLTVGPTTSTEDGTSCRARYDGKPSNLDEPPTGIAQIDCVDADERTFGVYWAVSREGVGKAIASANEDVTADEVEWDHGSGFLDENGRALLTFDAPGRQNVLLIVLPVTDGDDAVSYANSLPL